MNKDDYIPIDCERYSRYELAIIRHNRLRVGWRDPDGSCHLDCLEPFDLQTRNHAEYLLASTSDGHKITLRLDRIIDAQELIAV